MFEIFLQSEQDSKESLKDLKFQIDDFIFQVNIHNLKIMRVLKQTSGRVERLKASKKFV